MPPLSQAQVETWVEDFMEVSSPPRPSFCLMGSCLRYPAVLLLQFPTALATLLLNLTLSSLSQAMQSPPDWKKLQEMMNKRCTVEMPDEPKAKKFEDWKKKAEPFFASFKSAKRTMPKGTKPIIVQSKKDEVEVIYAEQCKFTWTKGLEESYPNCTIASGDKAKIFIYNRVLINGKGEGTWFQPVFSKNDFKMVSFI